MFVEVGPASIVVTGEKAGRDFACDEGEIKRSLGRILTDLGGCLTVLRQKGYRIKNPAYLPPIGRAMVEAVQAVDGLSLTPMAAVAGAVADAVREELKAKGLDFISVNNGGDISFFNRHGRDIRIGVGDIRAAQTAPYILKLKGIKEGGLATSGFGGRSLTLGIADMATVLAPTGAIADAAATSVCNAVNVESESVERRRAAEIDPSSDIAQEWVTVSVGPLGEDAVRQALLNGLVWARTLKARGLIHDAVISLRGRVVTTWDEEKHIHVEVSRGDQETCHDR